MRRIPDIGAAALALCLVVLLLVPREVVLSVPPPVPVIPECTGSACGELEEVLEELENGALDEEAEEVAAQPGLQAAGDTCFMRHPGLAPNVPRAWRRDFALTTLAGPAADKLELLAPLLESAPDPVTQWRVRHARADVFIRAGDPGAARTDIAAALALPGVPPPCRSDTLRLRARMQQGPARLETLITAAVADPASFLAQVDLALAAARAESFPPSHCETLAVATIRAVVQIDALIARDRQLLSLERALGPQPDGVPALFLAGLVQERGARPQAALARYDAALARLSVDPCGAIYRSPLAARRTALSETGEERP